MKLKLKINRKYIFAFLAFLLLIFSVITVIFSLKSVELNDASVAELGCGLEGQPCCVNQVTKNTSCTFEEDEIPLACASRNNGPALCFDTAGLNYQNEIDSGILVLISQIADEGNSTGGSSSGGGTSSGGGGSSSSGGGTGTSTGGNDDSGDDSGLQGSDEILGDYLSGFGKSCQLNYGVCPSGYTNVLKGLSEGKVIVKGDLKISEVIQSIYNSFETEREALQYCLKSDNLELIQRIVTAPELSIDNDSSLEDQYQSKDVLRQNLYPQRLPIAASSRDQNFKVPRVCPNGWNANEGKYAITNFSKLWGCCPDGFRFTNVKDEQFSEGYQAGACCRVEAGSRIPDYWDSSNGCMDIEGEQIYPINDTSYSSIQAIESNLANINNFQYYTDSSGVRNNVVLGLPIGPGASEQGLNDQVRLTDNLSGASKICPENYNNGCVLLSTGVIENPADLKSAGANNLSCARCFLPNEAIRLVDVDGSTEKKLQMCDPTAEGRVKNIDLINGNVQDTLAYLKADEQNQPYLQACREGGGIYIAIGCVDPSPIGIITGLIRLAFGVMGGVALIQLILAGIAYQQGDEGKIEEAKERVIATISGLAVLVFSVLILEILGVNILDVLPA